MRGSPVLTEAVYYILLSLIHVNHGYGIMQDVAQMSGGRVKLAAGTLYGALNTLVDKKWITAMLEEGGSRKKEYLITEEGMRVLKEEIKRLKELVSHGEESMGGINYVENSN